MALLNLMKMFFLIKCSSKNNPSTPDFVYSKNKSILQLLCHLRLQKRNDPGAYIQNLNNLTPPNYPAIISL